ncbi:MAG: SCO family protein [Alphaproteobacteria bacterium]
MLILSTFALLVGAGIGYVQVHSQTATVIQKEPQAGTSVAGVQVGGPFTLIDQDGKTVTEKSYPGQYKLVFFGFTYCPFICPTELGRMAKVMDMLGADADKIQPVFISTDPGRDTPPVMKEYVTKFHPKLVGLTGTPTQIEAAKQNYRVFAKKVEGAAEGDYSLDHSTFTYLMGLSGEFLSVYRSEDTADYIAQDIRSKF